jgi:hypothetical protein
MLQRPPAHNKAERRRARHAQVERERRHQRKAGRTCVTVEALPGEAASMLDPPARKPKRRPPAAPASAASRRKRYRDRVRRCVIVVPVEIDDRGLQLLVDLRWLDERQTENRAAIGTGIAALLRDAADEGSLTRGSRVRVTSDDFA